MHKSFLAALAAAAFLTAAPALPASAQTPSHLQTPQVVLAAGETRWAVREDWNDDRLIYTFYPDGRFVSSSGSGGQWLQTGSRIIMDWPEYGAIYIGRMQGAVIAGVGRFDDGARVGAFELRLVR